jgi:hypothetical protein
MTGLPASLRLPRKPAGTARQGFGATSRIDDWATEPGIVAFGFTAFIVYSLFSALLWYPLFGVAYEVDGYLSPFFSPLIHPDWMPTWFSPAILILWIPLGFRTTCYYYRKAYYRSYFAEPQSASRRSTRSTGWRPRSRSSSRTCIGSSSISRSSRSSSCGSTRSCRCSSTAGGGSG